MAIRSCPAQTGIPGRRLVNLAIPTRLLFVVVLAFSSAGCTARAPAEPPDLEELVGRAQILEPIAASTRERLERQHDSWRGELISFDLKRQVETRPQQLKPHSIDLEEALRSAKPAPMPSPGQRPSSRSSAQRDTLDEHATPGEVTTERSVPSSPPVQEDVPRRVEPQGGEDPLRAPHPEGTASLITYRILTLYIVDGKEFCFECQGTRLDRNELLTAGHCVYQHDPNGDGDANDAGWAAKVWVWPASLEPSAALHATRLAAHREYISRGAPEHDFGVVTVPALSSTVGPETSDPDR